MKPLIVFIALCIIFPAAVSAHAHMQAASPRRGAVVTIPPAKVRLILSDALEPAFFTVTVADSAGKTVSGETQFLEDNAVTGKTVFGFLLVISVKTGTPSSRQPHDFQGQRNTSARAVLVLIPRRPAC